MNFQIDYFNYVPTKSTHVLTRKEIICPQRGINILSRVSTTLGKEDFRYVILYAQNSSV